MTNLENAVRERCVDQGHADSETVKLPLKLGENLGDGRRRSRRGRGKVYHARTAAPKVLRKA